MVVALLACLLLASGFWAGRATTSSPSSADSDLQSPRTMHVSEQEVGRTLTLVTTVTREYTPVASNRLAGTVTAVGDVQAVETGDLLYEVEKTPVIAFTGTLPFYRDLARGDKGQDVTQLQDGLNALGLLPVSATGTFGVDTENAVKKWQKSLGLEQTGAVRLGTVVAIPTMPSPVRLDETLIATGLLLSGGEPAISVPGADPVFVMHLSTAQADLIPSDAPLTVSAGELSWPAVISSSAPGDQGADLTLSAPDGSSVCGEDCGSLGSAESTNLMTSVDIVPTVKGPAIPLSAVTTRADGSTTVRRADGSEVAVEVRGVENGVAVVDGLEPGEEIELPGEPAATPSDGGEA